MIVKTGCGTDGALHSTSHVNSALTLIGQQDAGSRDTQLDQASSCSDSDVIFDV